MSLSDNPFAYKDVKLSTLGTENLSSQFGKFSGVGDWDWGSQPGKEAYGGSSSSNKSGGGWSSEKTAKLAGTIGSLLSKAGEQKSYREEAEKGSKVQFGEGSGGRAGQVLDNLGAVFPQMHAPIILGASGPTGKTTGQRIAGGLGGALSGVAAGAPFGPIGMAVGGLMGAAGGALG